MKNPLHLNNKTKIRKYQLIGAIFISVLLSSTITFAIIESPAFSYSDNEVEDITPRLMEDSSLQIPDYLYQLLSEEDRLLLEEYGQYNTQFSDEDLAVLRLYDEYVQQMKDPGFYSLQANEYLMNRWMPQEEEITIPVTGEFPSYEETFGSFFFDDWMQEPTYSLPSEGVEQVNEQIVVDDLLLHNVITEFGDVEVSDSTLHGEDLSIHERVISTGEQTVTQKTTITGKPRVKLVEPQFTGFDNVKIEIRDKVESIEDQGIITKVINVTMGFEFWLPDFDHDLYFEVAIIRFNAWAKFIAGFHIWFPVQLSISYPAEVAEGESYSLKVKLIPWDIPDENEFELKFVIDVGVSLDIKIPKLYWVQKTGWLPGFKRSGWRLKWVRKRYKFNYWVPRLTWTWKNVWSYPIIDYEYNHTENYLTPLAGEHVDIDFGFDLDILPLISKSNIPYISSICKVLEKFLEIGMGFGLFEVFGKAVTGELAVTAGSYSSSNTVGWTHSEEINSIDFVVPDTTASYLGLSVDELIFHSRSVKWVPEFFINFKDLDVGIFDVPLSKWLGTYRWQLPGIDFGEMNLPSLDTYAIHTSEVVASDTYDFTMSVEEITPAEGQGALVTTKPNDQLFEVTLQNSGRNDIVELEVQGLPLGYTATFDRGVPQYSISSSPTTVQLVLSPPETIDEDPGPWPFNITATSQGKTNLNLANTTLIKRATLEIPVITGISLSIDTGINPTETVAILPGSMLPINFVGLNLGNLDDTINVESSITAPDGLTLFNLEQPFSVGSSYNNPSFGGYIPLYYNDFDWSQLQPPSTYVMSVSAYSERYAPFPDITRLLSCATETQVSVEFVPDYNVTTIITPESQTMYANFASEFTYLVNNTGNTDDNFTVTTEGWDDYIVFLDDGNISNLGPNEIYEIDILLNITDPENIPSKDYTFRIKTTSDGSGGQVFSTNDVIVKVLPADFVPPGVVYESTYDSLTGLTLPQSSLFSNGPVWLVTDNAPGIFTVYIDDSVYNTSTWKNGELLEIPVTGINPLSQGVHNITIVVKDDAGNSYSDQIDVTVIPSDSTLPIISKKSNGTLPQNFATPYPVSWNFTEEFVYNLTLYRNGAVFNVSNDPNFRMVCDPEDENRFLVDYLIQPGTLTAGVWNYTFGVRDLGNNFVSSSIYVTINSADSDAPSFTSVPNSIANIGHSESLSFTLSDANPERYELWINNTLEINTSWESLVEINLPVNDLSLSIGMNDLDLYVYDLASNNIGYGWTFTLRDIDTPIIISAPSDDMTIFEHNRSQYVLLWEVADMQDTRPGQYEIYQDSVLVKTGQWTIGNNKIRLLVNELSPGDYRFAVHIKDYSENTIVSYLDLTVADILAPYIWPHNPIEYEPIYTASWFEFFISESHPETYSLYRTSELISSGELSNDFPFIFVDISDLETGDYIYALQVTDESGNMAQRQVLVKVTDRTAPYIKRPADFVLSEGTTSSILWQILEANPQSYSLYLDDQLLTSDALTETNLTTPIGSLSLGLHKYTLLVYDSNGKTHSVNCYVAVVDISAPTLSHIADCRLKMNDPDIDLSLTWQADDLHPSSYRITLDHNLIRDGGWSGEDIVLQLGSIETNGTYIINLEVRDTSGNVATDEVQVVLIIDEANITSKRPVPISTPGFSLLLAFSILAFLKIFRRKKREK